MEGKFIINGKKKKINFDSEALLSDVLRENGHTEVKIGCREGECGACLVLLNEKPVNSCQVLAASVLNSEIVTVKGIGDIHSLHPIQKAFIDSGAVQCGFCIPGMVIAVYALLKENDDPDEEEIKDALDGNLCRCTGYVKIIEAVKLAAGRIRDNERV